MNSRPKGQIFSHFSSMLFPVACVFCMIYQQYEIVDLFLQHKVAVLSQLGRTCFFINSCIDFNAEHKYDDNVALT